MPNSINKLSISTLKISICDLNPAQLINTHIYVIYQGGEAHRPYQGVLLSTQSHMYTLLYVCGAIIFYGLTK